MIRIIGIALGVDRLSINFSVDRLSVIVLTFVARCRWRWYVHGHLLVPRSFDIERCHPSVHACRLIWLNIGVELGVIRMSSLMAWFYWATETVHQ